MAGPASDIFRSGPGVVGRSGKNFIDKRTMLLVRHLLVGGGVAAFDAFQKREY